MEEERYKQYVYKLSLPIEWYYDKEYLLELRKKNKLKELALDAMNYSKKRVKVIDETMFFSEKLYRYIRETTYITCIEDIHNLIKVEDLKKYNKLRIGKPKLIYVTIASGVGQAFEKTVNDFNNTLSTYKDEEGKEYKQIMKDNIIYILKKYLYAGKDVGFLEHKKHEFFIKLIELSTKEDEESKSVLYNIMNNITKENCISVTKFSNESVIKYNRSKEDDYKKCKESILGIQ